MVISRSLSSTSGKDLPILAVVSFLVIQFLFFIDEGWYDLRWMRSIGNWFVFVLYWGLLLGVQLLCHKLVFGKFENPLRLVLSVIGGIVFLILFMLALGALISMSHGL